MSKKMNELESVDQQIVEFEPPEQQANNMLAIINNAAQNPEVDVDKMRALLDMKKEVDAMDAERIFNRAMNKCQGKIGRITADKKNGATKDSPYASYAALDRVVRPIYTEHGFSLSFNTEESAADVVRVVCYVSHEDGHTRTYRVDMPADGKGAKGGDVMTKTHAAGSAMQYGQRYLLKFIFNLAIGKDDDGNAATKPIELVTEEQVINLQSVIEEIKGFDNAAFFKWISAATKMEITKLSEIPKKDFTPVLRGLEQKRAEG